jgi:hypothetical protein
LKKDISLADRTVVSLSWGVHNVSYSTVPT